MTKKSSSSDKQAVTIDFSTTSRGPTHYLAMWIWLGTLFWYLMYALAIPVLLYYRSPWLGIITVLFVTATLLPSNRKLQPKWCWTLGDWIVQKASQYCHLRMILMNAEAIKTSGTAIFAIEPHDVLPLSIIGFNDCLKGIPGHRCLGIVTSFCFNMPFMKHIYTWVNAASADKKNIIRMIKSGISPVICPGGVQEVTLMENDHECVLYLKSRLGFVKLAIQQGTPIIPVFSFGLRNTFDCWLPKNKWVQKMGRQVGFMPLIFFGMWSLPFSPGKPTDYTVIVGEPIKVVQADDPSVADIQKYHALFIHKMADIYEQNKEKYGMKEVKLRIV